jgi:hypothetical protein
MPKCIHCDKIGLYENFTLCRGHKHLTQISELSEYSYDSSIDNKPIYCLTLRNAKVTVSEASTDL